MANIGMKVGFLRNGLLTDNLREKRQGNSSRQNIYEKREMKEKIYKS